LSAFITTAPPSALDLFSGVLLPVRAAHLIARSRRLRKLALAAAALTLVALAVSVALTVAIGPALLQAVWVKPASLVGQLGWDLALLLVATLIGFSLISLLPSLSLNLLQDAIVDAAARHRGATAGVSASGFETLWRGLSYALLRLSLLWAGQALLLVLLLTPAAAAWPFASAGWTAACLATEQLSNAMGRFGHPFRDVIDALLARPLLSLGVGLALTALFWIPVVDLFFVPVAVVTGTLLYTGLREGGSIAPPP
jgi:CysZ protein